MEAYALRPLIRDMQKNKVDMEHYTFRFNGFAFDVVISLKPTISQILVGIHNVGWGCVIPMDENLKMCMRDRDFFALCNVLHLKAGKEEFTSFKFLLLLSKSAPKQSSRDTDIVRFIRPFVKYIDVDESDKIYFKEWRPHISDGKRARNFQKTEFFFGKEVADFCRQHNISSVWSPVPLKNERITAPKGFRNGQ